MIQKTALVEYSTATKLARTYEASTARIAELLSDLDKETKQLRNVFQDQYNFQLFIEYDGRRHIAINDDSIASIME